MSDISLKYLFNSSLLIYLIYKNGTSIIYNTHSWTLPCLTLNIFYRSKSLHTSSPLLCLAILAIPAISIPCAPPATQCPAAALPAATSHGATEMHDLGESGSVTESPSPLSTPKCKVEQVHRIFLVLFAQDFDSIY